MTAETHKKPGLETLRAAISRLEGHGDRRRKVLPFGGLALGAPSEMAGGWWSWDATTRTGIPAFPPA
ncbi:hypothetical protein [Acetobacter estunensis]|uniref:hypothetical protein n=1 Tax=Acetobacter estunensis TaxID=104097 RepID=UPI0020C1E043|nr:hypothetical protein [Acetobacter estunensis]